MDAKIPRPCLYKSIKVQIGLLYKKYGVADRKYELASRKGANNRCLVISKNVNSYSDSATPKIQKGGKQYRSFCLSSGYMTLR